MHGMRKFLSEVLIILIASGASARTAFAAPTEHDAERAAKVKRQIDGLAPGTVIKVKLKDHRKIEGELVARSEESFQLNAPESTEVSYTEVKSIAELDGQVSTGGTSGQQPSHHYHRVLKYVIIVAVVFGLTVALASLDK